MVLRNASEIEPVVVLMGLAFSVGFVWSTFLLLCRFVSSACLTAPTGFDGSSFACGAGSGSFGSCI